MENFGPRKRRSVVEELEGKIRSVMAEVVAKCKEDGATASTRQAGLEFLGDVAGMIRAETDALQSKLYDEGVQYIPAQGMEEIADLMKEHGDDRGPAKGESRQLHISFKYSKCLVYGKLRNKMMREDGDVQATAGGESNDEDSEDGYRGGYGGGWGGEYDDDDEDSDEYEY